MVTGERVVIERGTGSSARCRYALACGQEATAFWLCRDGNWRPYCAYHDRLFQRAAKEGMMA